MIVTKHPDKFPKLPPCDPRKNESVRPYRDHEVYAAFCIGCGREIESDTPAVPLRCANCEKAKP